MTRLAEERRVLLLTGGPGVGKSTTLDALAASLALLPEAPRVFRTVADDTTRRRPFELVAALAGLEPEYPPPADQAERVVDGVERLCGAGPVVLVADDVHQADPDSLKVLLDLASATAVLPLTLLLAARPLPVREQLAALAARPGVVAAEVTGLDDAELGALVVDRFGAPPGRALRELLAGTGGNPFHAGALLDDLHRRGRLAQHGAELEVTDSAHNGVPDSVRSAARAHLAVVEARTRELLQVLAVWGCPVSVARLAETSAVSPVALLGPVQAAVAAGLARWTTDGELLEFRHDLYREVVYADLDPPLRRVLHDACAAVLRAEGRTGTEVLHHEAGTAGPVAATRALQVVRDDLGEAPAQAADLLAEALASSAAEADVVAVARAQALAAAGDMRQAERVARERIAATADPAAAAALTRILLHVLTNAADVAGALSSFHLASAGQDEDQHGLDERGGPARAAADLAQDPPALQLGIRALARTTLASVSGVDLSLVAREPPPTALGIAGTSTLRDGEPAAAVSVVGDHPNLRAAQRVDQAVLAGSAHVMSCAGQRR